MAHKLINLKEIKPKTFKEEMKEDGVGPQQKQLPTLHVSLDHLPVAKEWEIDREYVILMKVKQSSLGRRNASFDIMSIGGMDYKEYKGSSHEKPKKKFSRM